MDGKDSEHHSILLQQTPPDDSMKVFINGVRADMLRPKDIRDPIRLTMRLLRAIAAYVFYPSFSKRAPADDYGLGFLFSSISITEPRTVGAAKLVTLLQPYLLCFYSSKKLSHK